MGLRELLGKRGGSEAATARAFVVEVDTVGIETEIEEIRKGEAILSAKRERLEKALVEKQERVQLEEQKRLEQDEDYQRAEARRKKLAAVANADKEKLVEIEDRYNALVAKIPAALALLDSIEGVYKSYEAQLFANVRHFRAEGGDPSEDLEFLGEPKKLDRAFAKQDANWNSLHGVPQHFIKDITGARIGLILIK